MKTTKAGFTLVEVILVIVLTGILSSVIVPVILQAVESLHYDQERSRVVTSSRLALDRLGMEIRRIRSAADISTMTESSLAFTDVEGHTIATELDPPASGQSESTLTFVYDGSASVLSTLVDSFRFTYLDSNGDAIDPSSSGAAGQVRTIRMTGSFSPDTTIQYDIPYDLSTEIRPANLASEEALLP